MSRAVKIILGILGALLLVGLVAVLVLVLLFSPTSSSEPQPGGEASLPNPASVYCQENGGRWELRSAADGGQYGVCIFPDGSECEEWAFYRGECGPEG
jgi:inhibitor of cysteine peptidase